jgi:hypothetical protein
MTPRHRSMRRCCAVHCSSRGPRLLGLPLASLNRFRSTFRLKGELG